MIEAHGVAPVRMLRGLTLGLTLTACNLAGAFLTVLALGGLGAWSPAQFIGLFAVIEIGTGVAFVFGPNIWRLPAAEAELAPKGHVRFAATTILIPHWVGGVKSLGGAALLGWTFFEEGTGPASLGLIPAVALIILIGLGLSALVARLGVARPDLDVIQIVMKRPGKPDHALPPTSIGASTVQLLLNIGVFPIVKALPPDPFYRPEPGPSAVVLIWLAGTAAVLCAAAALSWRGRTAWRASPQQQREAEEALAT